MNRAAFVIHSAIHAGAAGRHRRRARHSRLRQGVVARSGIPLDPITQDACLFYEDHIVISAQGGAVVFDDRGRQGAGRRTSRTGKAAIHQNHGLFTVGETVDEAACWFVIDGAFVPGATAGRGRRHAEADPARDGRATRSRTSGFPLAGWFSFQPMWQEICQHGSRPVRLSGRRVAGLDRARSVLAEAALRPRRHLAVRRRGHRRLTCSTRRRPRRSAGSASSAPCSCWRRSPRDGCAADGPGADFARRGDLRLDDRPVMNLCFYLAIDRLDLGNERGDRVHRSDRRRRVASPAPAQRGRRSGWPSLGVVRAVRHRDRRRPARAACSSSSPRRMWAGYIVVGRAVARSTVASPGSGSAWLSAPSSSRRSACPAAARSVVTTARCSSRAVSSACPVERHRPTASTSTCCDASPCGGSPCCWRCCP